MTMLNGVKWIKCGKLVGWKFGNMENVSNVVFGLIVGWWVVLNMYVWNDTNKPFNAKLMFYIIYLALTKY